VPLSSLVVSAFCVGPVAVPETGSRDLRSYTPWISFRTCPSKADLSIKTSSTDCSAKELVTLWSRRWKDPFP
jgi:hypothetical protein